MPCPESSALRTGRDVFRWLRNRRTFSATWRSAGRNRRPLSQRAFVSTTQMPAGVITTWSTLPRPRHGTSPCRRVCRRGGRTHGHLRIALPWCARAAKSIDKVAHDRIGDAVPDEEHGELAEECRRRRRNRHPGHRGYGWETPSERHRRPLVLHRRRALFGIDHPDAAVNMRGARPMPAQSGGEVL